MPAAEHVVSDLATFSTQVQNLSPSGTNVLWYRGIGSPNHTLVPSLYRQRDVLAGTKDALQLEGEISTRFNQRSLPFLPRNLEDAWDRLFFMQHYGIPTRLLDWSENPLIALFFALSSVKMSASGTATEDAVVWTLDPGLWNSLSLAHLSCGEVVFTTEDDRLNGHKPNAPAATMNNDPVAIYGIHNSARIMAQRGVFTVFGKGRSSMETICDSWSPCPLTKILVRAAQVPKVFRQLQLFGITDSVIYPDLSGLSSEIRRFFNFI